jgi:hypothetical protein
VLPRHVALIAFLDRSDSFHPLFRGGALQFLAFIAALPSLSIQGFDATELAKAGRMPVVDHIEKTPTGN